FDLGYRLRRLAFLRSKIDRLSHPGEEAVAAVKAVLAWYRSAILKSFDPGSKPVLQGAVERVAEIVRQIRDDPSQVQALAPAAVTGVGDLREVVHDLFGQGTDLLNLLDDLRLEDALNRLGTGAADPGQTLQALEAALQAFRQRVNQIPEPDDPQRQPQQAFWEAILGTLDGGAWPGANPDEQARARQAVWAEF